MPAVLDAYCAHLGAHLGVGKGPLDTPDPGPPVIIGDCIQCQFHGWRYDASGACVEIPYSSAPIPAQARGRGWDVLEVNGLIFAWHHLREEPPAWTLPSIPEFGDPAWVEPVYSDRVIPSCLQEVGENDVDFAHFQFVHGTPAPRPGEVVFTEGGRVKITTGASRRGWSWPTTATWWSSRSSCTRTPRSISRTSLRSSGRGPGWSRSRN